MPTASQARLFSATRAGSESTPRAPSQQPTSRRTSMPTFSPQRITIQFPQSYLDHRYGGVRKYGPQSRGYVDINNLMKSYRSGEHQSQNASFKMAPDFGISGTWLTEQYLVPLRSKGQPGSLSARAGQERDHSVQLTPRLLLRSQSEPNLCRRPTQRSSDPYAARFEDGIPEKSFSRPGTPDSSLMGYQSDYSQNLSPTESEGDFSPSARTPVSDKEADRITSAILSSEKSATKMTSATSLPDDGASRMISATSSSEKNATKMTSATLLLDDGASKMTSATSSPEKVGTNKGAVANRHRSQAGENTHEVAGPLSWPKSFKTQSQSGTMLQTSDDADDFVGSMPGLGTVGNMVTPISRALTATGYGRITVTEGTVLYAIPDCDSENTLDLSRSKTDATSKHTSKVWPRSPLSHSPKTNINNSYARGKGASLTMNAEAATSGATRNGLDAAEVVKTAPSSSFSSSGFQSSRLQQLTDEKKLRTLEPVRLFASLPRSHPLTICFDHPGTDVTHRMVMEAVNRVVRTFESRAISVQFVPRNVILGIGWCENRWLVTMDSDKAFNILTGRGVSLGQNSDRIKCRPYDQVLKEEYDRYLKNKERLETAKKRKIKESPEASDAATRGPMQAVTCSGNAMMAS